MPPTLQDVESAVFRNLAAIPFYGEILPKSVGDHLRRCASARDALRSRIIRELYLGIYKWVTTAEGFSSELVRIDRPERALPRFRKKSSSLSPRDLSRKFDQAMLDGFAAIDAAVYAIRELKSENVEMLRQRGTVRTPDAVGRMQREEFPIEAKRVRGEEGFYLLQDEIDSRRALDLERLSRPGVRVRILPPTPRHILEKLSEAELNVIGGSFERLAHRLTGSDCLKVELDLGNDRRIAIEVGDDFLPGGLMVSGPGGSLLPFDTIYLEGKIAERLEEAASQLAAFHSDEINRSQDFAFVEVELPGRSIFECEEIEGRLRGVAQGNARRIGIRVALRFSY